MKTVDIDWLKPQVDCWQAAVAADRTPHAVLLAGPAGVGKRALGDWLAGRQLGLAAGGRQPVYPAPAPTHPDLHRLRPPEDKKSIGIDQVRELVAELTLTSHEGRGKVAIIEPANLMTVSAANSLLKTLEEPPGHALLILVADRAGHLPPTVRSRCQQLNIGIPAEALSLAWLDRLRPGGNWGAALREAGGAPLAAVEASERLDQTESMARDFGGIAEHRVSPLEVAARWAKEEPDFVLDWLGRQVRQCIYRSTGSAPGSAAGVVADSVLNRIDRRNLFCYLDIINALRGQQAGSFNVQLTLEGLLIDWARGLVGCRPPWTGNPDARMTSGTG
jgi:DNA polymerase-3 subunit delta'